MSLDEPEMSTLLIRNVDGALKARLRVRAAQNGRSMEAELRQILSDSLPLDRDRDRDLAESIRRRFAPLGDVDLEHASPVAPPAPPSFE